MKELKELSKSLKGKDADKLVHKAKKESSERLLAQGISSMALYMSQLMMEAVKKDKNLIVKTGA